MKQVYPQYADRVSFYAIGMDPGFDIADFEEFRLKQDYPWPVAVPIGDLIADFRVNIQSTKIAFDGEGVITHRGGMGYGSPEIWRQVFTDLAVLSE
jgi:hypothetical protein